MPAALSEKPDRSEQMKNALKAHIIRERARKKQEQEAEVEEERLRKEREAREQENVMTLGETREQISNLETKLTQLKDEKHQLFLQLKKVLNEDDNRRRQLIKESDIITLQQLPPTVVHQQLYLPQGIPRTAPVVQHNFKTAAKRPRSPSPQPSVPASLYHQNYSYKPPNVINSSYQSSPQKDEGRRHELVRAVLWNKTQAYPNQPSAFYTVPPQELSMYYPQSPMTTREPPRNMYDSPRPQAYHLDQKAALDHYSLRPPSSHATHVIHGTSLTLSPAQPPSKTGGIASGYPVRTQTQYQQPSPASLYTTQSRPLYQSPGTPISYPPRE